MKVIERIIVHLIKNRIKLDEMQFDFVPRKNTDVFFVVKHLEKYLAKNKVLLTWRKPSTKYPLCNIVD